MKRTLKSLEEQLTKSLANKKNLETEIRKLKRMINDLKDLIDEETEIVTSAQQNEVVK